MKYRFANLVAGEWTGPAAGNWVCTFDPARPDQPVGRYQQADAATVDVAVAAAGRAQRQWAALPLAERRGRYERFIDAIERQADALARSITAEMGKTLKEARAEVLKACAEARFMLSHALEASGGRAMPALRPSMNNAVHQRPRGVIVAIAAWNFPVMTPMRKIAPAIAFGNAVILKPSEYAPAASCLLGEIAAEYFPAGLLQILHGGAGIGDRLVRHPDVQGVTFTGSVATGRRIRSATADNLAETALEMGGKNAALVHDVDALGPCLDQIRDAAFMSSGQRCTAVSRVLVSAALHDAVVGGLAERAAAMVPGDGSDPASDLGPLAHRQQFAHVEAMVQRALAAGAKAACGAASVRVPGCEGGLFYAPTVLHEVTHDMEIAREEVFGPVISVIRYRTLDEAFAILNATDYGLSGALFSHDIRVIQRFIAECRTGMLHVNHGTIPDSHMPFGGIKASGVGAYSVGPSAAAFFTTEHAIYVHA